MTWSKTTTTASGQWNDTGADNYVVQRSTSSNFSDAVEILSGDTTAFSDTGLTIATTYYYRVKAQKSGVDDSEWTTSSVTTIMAMPEFWYEGTGMLTGVDNEYAGVDNLKIEEIHSIINTDGYTLTAGSSQPSLQPHTSATPYYSFTGIANIPATASGQYTFSGDFLLAFRFSFGGVLNNNQFIRNSIDANQYIRFNSATAIRPVIAGSGVTITIAELSPNVWHDFVLKRESDVISVSLNGGDTFPYSGTLSGTFVFDQFFPSLSWQRLVGYDYIPSDASVRQIFEYLKQPTYTEPADISPISVSGVTWSDHTGDYIVNTSFAKNVLASYIRDRIVNVDDYTFICGNTKTTAPDYSNDFIVIKKRSTGEVSDIKYLGVPRDIVDDHNNGSIFIDDNRIKHVEMDSHYDSGTPQPTDLLIKEFGNEFDFTNFTQRILANGIASVTNSTTQYYLFHRFSSTKKGFVFQDWVGGVSGAQYTGILISNDNFNSFDKYHIVDVGSPNWVYHNPIYSPDGKVRLFLNFENKEGGDRNNYYDYLFYVESEDGLTWTNLAGDFSQNISGNNPILIDSLKAHCLVQDASASVLNGNAKIEWGFYDDSDGEISGIIGDGDDTGLLMLYSENGTWVTQPIDAGTKTLVYDLRVGNGDNSPILIRTGVNSYDAYVHEENGGAWKIIRKHTDDKGVTWTNGEDFSTDPTAQHKRMHVNRDALYNDHVTIGAARVVSDDNSDIFIKDAVGF